ncbi:MAG: hypothetical protein ACK58L_02375 [Planctomycetota bacterium]
MSTAVEPSAARRDQRHESIIERPGDLVCRGLLLQPAAYAAVGFLMSQLFVPVPLAAKLVLIAGVLLTLRRWGAVMVLVCVQADLFLREGRQFPALRGSDGLVFVLMTAAVLMFISRQRLLLMHLAGLSLRDLLRRWTGRSAIFHAAEDRFPPSNSFAEKSHARENGSALQLLVENVYASATSIVPLIPAALRGLTVLLACVTVARFLLSRIPTNPELTEQLRDMVNADPTLSSAALLFMMVLAVWVVISEIHWRQLTPEQARMYLRSELLREAYPDLRMFVIRRIRRRQKRILTASKAKEHSNSAGSRTK